MASESTSRSGKDKDFGKEDTTIGQPLLSKGGYSPFYTSLIKPECRHGLILCPADVRASLRDAGIKRAPEVMPDLRVRFALPKIKVIRAKSDPNEKDEPATGNDFLAAFPSISAQSDPSLAEAILDQGRGIQLYNTPYHGVPELQRAWMSLPFRTLVRAVGNPGRIYTHGQGFCLVPRVAIPQAQGTANYEATKQLIVGLSTSVRVRGSKAASSNGQEWIAVIQPLKLSDGREMSVVDTLFWELFQEDINDTTFATEQPVRPQRKGPLLQLFVQALVAGSDVYDKLIVAEGDSEEEGSEAAQRELRKRLLTIRLCTSCKNPLHKINSLVCVDCGARQPVTKAPVVAPVSTAAPADAVQPAAAAPVVTSERSGPVCPFNAAHRLKRPNSRFCDICSNGKELLNGQPVAPAAPVVVEAPPTPVKDDTKAGERSGPVCPFNAAHRLKRPNSRFCDLCNNGKTIVQQPVVAPVEPQKPAASQPPPIPKVCEKCGTHNEQDALFCREDGHQLGTPFVAPPPQPDPAKPAVERYRWCKKPAGACIKGHVVSYGSATICDACQGKLDDSKAKDFKTQVAKIEAERVAAGGTPDTLGQAIIAELAAKQPQPGAGTPVT